MAKKAKRVPREDAEALLLRDLRREARHRLLLWLQDTAMRFDVAGLQPVECYRSVLLEFEACAFAMQNAVFKGTRHAVFEGKRRVKTGKGRRRRGV